MSQSLELPENTKDLKIYRRLLILAATIYLFWWFAIEAILPHSFNPMGSRFSVVSCIYGILILTYFSQKVRLHVRLLFVFSMWLITAHYFYLFHGNGDDINWIVGCYITVVAVSFGLMSRRALLYYSIFVVLLSVGLLITLPTLRHSVFFLGVVTFLFQANVGLRSRLAALQTLADSNERFRLLFDSTFEGVLVHENGKIISVNESMAKMFDYSKNEMIGKDVLDIVEARERFHIAESMKKVHSQPIETTGYTKLGRSIAIEVRGKDFVFHNKPARLVTVQEISDRKRAEKERIAALALAENLRSRDEFISIASHEFKTPLSSLKLQIQMVAEDAKDGSFQKYTANQTEEFLSLFLRQVDRLTELVEMMLDVSQISAGKLKLKIKTFDLVELIRLISASLHAPRHDAKTFPLTLEAPDQLVIAADYRRIEQLVENLLMNALKYGENRPVQLILSKTADQAVLVVKDQGIGIAPEFVPRIFERFERAISARNISGLGLGLYIARQIVDAHGGKIRVESQLGKGSIFTVHLPLSAGKAVEVV